MDCSGAWSAGFTVDPVLFFLFTALMFLACLLGTLLMNVLLRHEDDKVQQAQAWAHVPVRDTRIGMQQVASVVFPILFVLLFAIGLHHY